MLVREDGTQAGTLGGGCVESEVRLRALRNIAAHQTSIEVFQLDNDYGWDDGLICGGRMTIVVIPVASDEELSYFRALCEVVQESRGVTQAVVMDANKSQAPAGSAVLISDDGGVLATYPATLASELSGSVAREAVTLQQRPRPYVVDGVSYLPVLERCRLLIAGGGHVGMAVASLAARVDFDVWVYDDRQDMVTEARFPAAVRRLSGPLEETLPSIEIDANTYCLIVTRGHHHDEQVLFHWAARGARYVGMIGSRRKIRMIFDDLRQEGISTEALAAVHAPVGIDIGSQTVDEIAISIVAELIAHRNCAGQVPGRAAAVDVS
jgi:xanthine dehydrogenase accessory factor